MGLIDQLGGAFLNSLPDRVKTRLFPILALILLEVATYFFFAFFFYAAEEKGTFRSVLTDFRWQVTALTEVCVAASAGILWQARARTRTKRRRLSLLMILAAIVILAAPAVFYMLVHPTRPAEERLDIFYLDYPQPVKEFDKDLLLQLLNYGGKGIDADFNWVDWSSWSVPPDFSVLGPLEQLDSLVARYQQRNPGAGLVRNPVAITSRRLEGNFFWIGAPIPEANLTVVSVADWESEFAPPTVYEYLLHVIFLQSLRYRLNDAGQSIAEHKVEDYSQAYFDKALEKRTLRGIICAGHFTKQDEELIRRTLGDRATTSYKEVLSLTWLQQEALQKRARLTPECFK